jgi:predicted esterase
MKPLQHQASCPIHRPHPAASSPVRRVWHHLASRIVLSLGLALSAPALVASDLEHPSEYLKASEFPGGVAGGDVDNWRDKVPQAELIEIDSSADGSSQSAFFYDSGSDEEKPLLIVLHSWSIDYTQNIDIPFAQFAVANDWVFIHPDFRGANDGNPDTTASDKVISDMQDALEYARENASVDSSRIYVLGYSGGAMNALHLASRNPDVFAGVAAWVPVYDLPDWYQWNASRGEKYAEEITEACGGVPESGSAAHDECQQRSPSSHADDLKGQMPILLAHGIHDDTVPPSHALKAFNDLVEEDDRIAESVIEELMQSREIPSALRERAQNDEANMPGFAAANADIELYLRSGDIELVLFDGDHDMLYRPGLDWLNRQQR